MEEQAIPPLAMMRPLESSSHQRQPRSCARDRSREQKVSKEDIVVHRRTGAPSTKNPKKRECKDAAAIISIGETVMETATICTDTVGTKRRPNDPPPHRLPPKKRGSGKVEDDKEEASSGVDLLLPTVVNNHHRNVFSNQEDEHVTDRLRDNDVLLGRGTGTNEYVGNVRFRNEVRQLLLMKKFRGAGALVHEEEDSKPSAGKSPKAPGAADDHGIPAPSTKKTNRLPTESSENFVMAHHIVHLIKSRGGRFLERVTPVIAGDKEAHSAEEDEAAAAASTSSPPTSSPCNYHEVDDRVAVDKTRQSFRHQMKSLAKDYGIIETRDSISWPSKRKQQVTRGGEDVLGVVGLGMQASKKNSIRYEQEHTNAHNRRFLMAANASFSRCFGGPIPPAPHLSQACSQISSAPERLLSMNLVVEAAGKQRKSMLVQRNSDQQHARGTSTVQPPPAVAEAARLQNNNTLLEQQREQASRQAAFLNTAVALSHEHPRFLGPTTLLYPRTRDQTQQHRVTNNSAAGAPWWSSPENIMYSSYHLPSCSLLPTTSELWRARQQLEEETRHLRQPVNIAQANNNRHDAQLTEELALFLALKQKNAGYSSL